jgi:hypothetical protein
MPAEKPEVKFLPGFFVDTIERDAEYPAQALPLHMSLFPPLKAPYYKAYGDTMKLQFNILPSVEITVGQEDLFDDEDKKVIVKRIEDSPQLQHVHERLVEVLGHLLHDSRFRQPYNPHITVQSSDQLQQGQTLLFSGFSVVEKVNGGAWIVRDKVGFKGGANEKAS